MLRSDLTGPDMPWKVCEQSDFAVGGTTLLDKLDRYIQESNAVIHLIGEATGSTGKPAEVAGFLGKRPDFLQDYPQLRSSIGDGMEVSYSQWEAYLALHHHIPLYLFLPADDFDDRQAGFSASDEEKAAQQMHFDRLRAEGLDRDVFSSAERLSSMVFRSISRLAASFGSPTGRKIAKSLEGIARIRDQAGSEDPEVKSAILPLNVDLVLPAHLIAGQSGRIEFHLREPGRTPLENVTVELTLGSSTVRARCDLLATGEAIQLTGEPQLIPMEEGTPQIRLIVGCSRLSSLHERFVWKSFANVHSPPTTGSLSGEQLTGMISMPVQLALEEEELRPRKGACGMELRPIPGFGKRFEMGSAKTERGRSDDEELHPVRFRYSWWMARHPVSQGQFAELMERNPSKFLGQSLEFPVENVTWDEAVEFCERLTQRERAGGNLPIGYQYRLPTEAEWEFSCGESGSSGMAMKDMNAPQGVMVVSHPISTFPLDGNRGANVFGLCDMTGNVFQWCLDGYGPYPHSIEYDPCAPDRGAGRVIRGGSWNDPSVFKRAAARAKCREEIRSSRIGFRVVLARV